MTKIKIGDTVERIKIVCGNDFKGMKIGDTDTVITVYDSSLTLKKFNHGHSLSCFKVININWRKKIEG